MKKKRKKNFLSKNETKKYEKMKPYIVTHWLASLNKYNL